MRDAFLPLFEWLGDTGAAQILRDSIWLFPTVQAFHLLGLAMLGGAVLLVDLRMLGFGLRSQSIANLVRRARILLIIAVVTMAVSGVLMVSPAATAVYFRNDSFWVKMSVLPIAILVTFLSREWIARKRPDQDTALWTRLVGGLSIVLWTTVLMAGRWIAFS